MVPSCSLGPTALDALNGPSQFLQAPSHLLASEIASLASWGKKWNSDQKPLEDRVSSADREEEKTKF